MSDSEAGARERRGRPAQAPFLEILRLQREEVAIYLTNGVRIQGVIAGFDDFVVQLASGQIIYKHTISSVGLCDLGARPRAPGHR